MADYLLTTEINSAAAKKGADEFVSAVNAIKTAERDLQKEMAAFAKKVGTDLQSIAASATKIKDALGSIRVGNLTPVRESIEKLAKTTGAAVTAVRALKAAFDSLRAVNIAINITGMAAALAAVRAFKTAVEKAVAIPVASKVNAPTGGATSGAALPGGAQTAGLVALEQALARIRTLAAEVHAALATVNANSVKGIAEAIGALATVPLGNLSTLSNILNGMSAALNAFSATVGSSQAKIVAFVKSMQGLGRQAATLSTGAKRLQEAGDAVGAFPAAGDRIANVAAALELLRESLKKVGGAAFATAMKKNGDAIAEFNVKTAGAVTNIAKIARALENLRDKMVTTVGAKGFDFATISGSVIKARSEVLSFARALGTMNTAPLTSIMASFGGIANSVRYTVSALAGLSSVVGRIEASLKQLPPALRAVSFRQLGRNAAGSVTGLQAMAVELRTVADRIRAIANDLVRIQGIFNGIFGRFGTNGALGNFVQQLQRANQLMGNLNGGARSVAGIFTRFGTLAPFRTIGAGLLSLGQNLNNLVGGRTLQGIQQFGASFQLLAASLGAYGAAGRNAVSTGAALNTMFAGARNAMVSGTAAALGFAIQLGGHAVQAMGALGSMAIRTTRAMMGWAGALTIGPVKRLIGGIIEASDEYTLLGRRVSVASRDFKESEAAMQKIYEVAQRTGSPIGELGNSFARFQRITQSWGTNIEQVGGFVESLTQGLKASGATAAETSSVLIQMSQAFSKGKLDGDELRSFSENGGLLIQVLEEKFKKGWGVIQDEFRKGKRSVADLFIAIGEAGPAIGAKLAKSAETIEQGMARLRNEWIKTIGELTKDNNFGGGIIESLERIRIIIAGPEFKQAMNNVMNWVVDGFAWLTKWVASFKDIGTEMRGIAATANTLRGYIPFAGGDKNARNNFDLEQKNIAAARANGPFQNLSNEARIEFEKIKAEWEKERVLQPLTIANGQQLRSQFANVATDVEQITERLRALNSGDIKFIPDDQLAKSDLLALKLKAIAEQVMSGNISSAVAAQADGAVLSGIATIDKLKSGLETRLTELQERQKQLAKEASAMSSYDPTATNEAAVALDPVISQLKKMVELAADYRALVSGTASQIGNKVGTVDQSKNAQPKVNFGGIKAPPVKETKDATLNSMTEKLNLLKSQTKELEQQLLADKAGTIEAKIQVEIEKLLTAEQKKQQPELAKLIEAEVRRKVIMQEQIKILTEMRQLGEQVGNTIVDSFIEGGKAGESFGATTKKALLQIFEQLARGLILQPLVKGLGNAFVGGSAQPQGGLFSGFMPFGGFGNKAGGDQGATGVAGMFGDGAAGATFATEVSTAGATFAAEVTAVGTTIATELASAGTLISTEIGAAGTVLTTEIGAVGTLFSTEVTAAGALFATEIAAAAATAKAVSFIPSAKGNVFGGTSKFANGGAFTNTIVNSPTAFPMRGGRTGIMGEAGPEAIMPLVKAPGGGYGVRVAGGGVMPIGRTSGGNLGVIPQAPKLHAQGGSFVGGNIVSMDAYRQQSVEAVAARSGGGRSGPSITINQTFEGGATREAAAEFEKRGREMATEVANRVIDSRKKEIIKDSAGAVRRKNLDNPNYLRR